MMPFIRSGKKSKKTREKARRQERDDRVIDEAVARTRVAVNGPGLCLPMCVLLQRVLAHLAPERPFTLRLGALNVYPTEGSGEPISFDPRHPEGIDAGFHAWLEDQHGMLLDPSVLITLAADGYGVDRDSYFLDGGRRFVRFDLAFVYEELLELELLGVERSEPMLARQLALALHGIPHPPGTIHLDVGWREGVPRPTQPGAPKE